jgi:hypothetical protein
VANLLYLRFFHLKFNNFLMESSIIYQKNS